MAAVPGKNSREQAESASGTNKKDKRSGSGWNPRHFSSVPQRLAAAKTVSAEKNFAYFDLKVGVGKEHFSNLCERLPGP
jgi:hypothetical protein